MKRNSLFILMGMFLALVVVAAWQTSRVSPPLPAPTLVSAQDNPNRLFPAVTLEDIQAFSIRDPLTGATLSFQRDVSDEWESLEFGVTPDEATVDRLAFTIAVLPSIGVIEDINVEQYPDYGLTQTDAFLVIILISKSGEQRTLLLGDVTLDGLGHYALVDEQMSVSVVDARPVAYIVTTLQGVYSPTPVPIPTATGTPVP